MYLRQRRGNRRVRPCTACMETVGPALQNILPAVKAMRNPDGTINPEAVKHNRNVMRAYQQGLGIERKPKEPTFKRKQILNTRTLWNYRG